VSTCVEQWDGLGRRSSRQSWNILVTTINDAGAIGVAHLPLPLPLYAHHLARLLVF